MGGGGIGKGEIKVLEEGTRYKSSKKPFSVLNYYLDVLTSELNYY